MFEFAASLYKKHREIITYLIFGVITTAVSYGVYFLLYNQFRCYASVSNAISWFLAVTVAYLTNKPFVFRSGDWSLRTVALEFTEFAGLRIVSGVLETVILFVLCDQMYWDGNWVKVATSVIVVILNYLASKFVVFRKKK